MKFRKAEWDVEMPSALVTYWTMWNLAEVDGVRALIDACVIEDVEWCDPRDSFVGRDELELCVRRLKEPKPDYRFEIVSEVDGHHDRLRYRWNMLSGRGRVLMEGLDIVTLSPDGLIARVDGFFGDLSPVRADGGVPERFHPAPD